MDDTQVAFDSCRTDLNVFSCDAEKKYRRSAEVIFVVGGFCATTHAFRKLV
jgi:hypothetical protein